MNLVIYVKVICPKCGGTFEWKWGRQKGVCDICEAELTIRDVKLAKGEILKLLQG